MKRSFSSFTATLLLTCGAARDGTRNKEEDHRRDHGHAENADEY